MTHQRHCYNSLMEKRLQHQDYSGWPSTALTHSGTTKYPTKTGRIGFMNKSISTDKLSTILSTIENSGQMPINLGNILHSYLLGQTLPMVRIPLQRLLSPLDWTEAATDCNTTPLSCEIKLVDAQLILSMPTFLAIFMPMYQLDSKETFKAWVLTHKHSVGSVRVSGESLQSVL